jgi:hypothetical protein
MAKRRTLVLNGVVGLTGAVVLASLLGVPVAGQAPVASRLPPAAPPRASSKPYVPPKTVDGQPDLQGFWTNSTYTPLERPANVNKAVYTPEEAVVAEKAAAEREAEQTEPGTVADVHYDFSQFGLDRSQSVFARTLRTSLIVDPPDGRVPPLTADGQRRAQERAAARKVQGGPYDAVENMPLGSRCVVMAGAGPPMMNAGYNANYQIVQAPGAVMILTEMIHDVRIIPLDGRPAPSPGLRQWGGVSRGRWEGTTLVVETTNFNGKNPFRGASDQLKVTERFTRVGPDEIQYRFTVEDPSTWAKPWTAEMPMAKTVGPIFEFACHETNYGVANILAGARQDERRAAEAKKGAGGASPR